MYEDEAVLVLANIWIMLNSCSLLSLEVFSSCSLSSFCLLSLISLTLSHTFFAFVSRCLSIKVLNEQFLCYYYYVFKLYSSRQVNIVKQQMFKTYNSFALQTESNPEILFTSLKAIFSYVRDYKRSLSWPQSKSNIKLIDKFANFPLLLIMIFCFAIIIIRTKGY